MSLESDFQAASDKSNSLSPSQDEKLELYAFYKQAKEGDVSGDRPGDFISGFKYDARLRVKGMKKEEAMKNYIALVNQLGG